MSRRIVLVAFALLCLPLAGCGAGSPEPSATARAPKVVTRPIPQPLQIANGPIEPADPGDRPLELKLVGRRDPVRVRFKRAPRSGLLFDLDTGRSSGGACPRACCRSHA